MEEDILNYSPTVMFLGTPCIITFQARKVLNFDKFLSRMLNQAKILWVPL